MAQYKSNDSSNTIEPLDLSIVIPAFNEASKIAADISMALQFIASSGITGEIIVVDDGSTDSTAKTVQDFLYLRAAFKKFVRLIRLDSHMGKGFAVKTGILASRGNIVMFVDSGSCVPYSSVKTGLDLLASGTCDIAHGSRRLKNTKILRRQKLSRRISSYIFRLAARLYIGLPRRFTDSQIGLKIYRGPVARELYQTLATQGFMFDLEIIMRALRMGLKIQEFPILWTCDRDSRLAPRKNLLTVFSELAALKKILAAEKPR